MGPCIIQLFHEPHWDACCCIQATMSSHQTIRFPSLTPRGFAALHSWHVACMDSGEAHIPGWSSIRSDIQPIMLLHQSEGVAPVELLVFHWEQAC